MMFGETEDLINYCNNEANEKDLEIIGLNNKNCFTKETLLCSETFPCSRLINKIEHNVV